MATFLFNLHCYSGTSVFTSVCFSEYKPPKAIKWKGMCYLGVASGVERNRLSGGGGWSSRKKNLREGLTSNITYDVATLQTVAVNCNNVIRVCKDTN